MRVLITRPLEDAASLARRLETGGVASQIEPMLEIHYLNTEMVDLSAVQGMLVTSANGLRAFAKSSMRRDLKVWAVGDGSARAARDAGFLDVTSASGDVGALARLVCNNADRNAGALLHVAGTRLAGDLGSDLKTAGFTYQRVVLYEARTSQALSDRACSALQAGALDGVLLYSPKTAVRFIELIKQHALEGCLKSVTAFCLSEAVANKTETLEWGNTSLASVPQEDALIEKIFRAAGET